MSKIPIAVLFILMLVLDSAMFIAHAGLNNWIGMFFAGLGVVCFSFLLVALAFDRTLT